MTSPESTAPSAVGKHLIYTYDNGWQYEIYVKNEDTLDYRIHHGLVGGRWVKDQRMHLVEIDDQIHKISWTEPTGTSVSLAVNLRRRRLHGVIFFPRWVVDAPERTVLFQNDHLEEMRRYRDAGPTYPIEVIDEFATITFVEDVPPGDDSVIACAPDQLPDGYLTRTN